VANATIAASQPLTPSPNPYAVLDHDFAECNWTHEDIETSHNAWSHPGATKMDDIIVAYPEHFPKDPKYRAAARKHRCPVCDPVSILRQTLCSEEEAAAAALTHVRVRVCSPTTSSSWW